MTMFGKHRVYIVGFCSPHRDWVNYNDPDAEIWGLNRGYLFMPRATRWWDMHSPEIRAWQHRRPGNHLDFLKSFPGPVYLHQAETELPNSVTYPLAEIAEDLGRHVFRSLEDGTEKSSADDPYLDSSVAFEIALAIHEGFKEIYVYGIDLSTAGEYVWQRSGVQYLLGVAAGRGIKVVIPEPCPLLRGNLYGRGYLKAEGERLTAPQLETRLQAVEQERDHLVAEYHQVVGHQRELDWAMSQFLPLVDHLELQRAQAQGKQDLATVEQRLTELQAAYQEALEIHRQAAERDHAGLTTEVAELNGARKLLSAIIDRTPPGIQRERLEDRAKRVAQLSAELSARIAQAQGRVKELVYLIHQTADGQPGREAIQQLSEGDLSAMGEVNEPMPERVLAGVA